MRGKNWLSLVEEKPLLLPFMFLKSFFGTNDVLVVRKSVQRLPSFGTAALNTRMPTSVFALIIFLHPLSSLYTSRSDQRGVLRALACWLIFLHFLVWGHDLGREPQPASNFFVEDSKFSPRRTALHSFGLAP